MLVKQARAATLTRQVPRIVAAPHPRAPRAVVASAGLTPRGLPERIQETLVQLIDRIQDPSMRNAVKEPVAFWGGLFAGILGLSTQDEPLRGWLERTTQQAKEPLQKLGTRGGLKRPRTMR